jgi:hypothetical protein
MIRDRLSVLTETISLGKPTAGYWDVVRQCWVARTSSASGLTEVAMHALVLYKL